jgi:uncharacterized UPF0160 family protein
MSKPRSCAVHDGLFHADEVTACGLLLLFDLIDRDKIVRTRDEAIHAQCEYVCDVGYVYDPKKKRFDHHQASYTGDLSSAGMVLLHLKDIGKITQADHDYFRKALIAGVDLDDIGRIQEPLGFCSFSSVVANFTPIGAESTPQELDAAFQKALDFVFGHLKRLWERYQYIQSCREEVRQAMEKGGEVLIFNRPLPWQDNFFELGGINHPAKFVIMPAGSHWKLRGIPPSPSDRMGVRVPMPEAWAGLGGEELQRVTGIPGAVFCHKGRFISVWETKEDALKALKMVLGK